MPTPFTAMTWNVENLFPPGAEVTPGTRVTEEEYEAKLDYVAGQIRAVMPDVLALQELGGESIGDRRALDALQERLGGEYPFAAISANPDDRGIRVGFLSRLPVLGTDEVVAFPAGELAEVPSWEGDPPVRRLGRGALRVDVEPAAGERVRLITVHLKSKLVTYRGRGGRPRFSPADEDERAIGAGLALARRTAEAVALRVYLNGLMTAPDESDTVTHTIVLGDFNDEPRAATSQLLLGPADADATTPDRLDTVRLYNLVDAIPMRGPAANDRVFLAVGERFSRIYQGRGELIDHVLVSRGLLGAPEAIAAGVWRVTEVRSLVAGTTGESVRDDPGVRVGRARPDHAPVYARFAL